MKAKVMEVEPNFKPIHIIIETREEAVQLWRRLNIPHSIVRDFAISSEYDEFILNDEVAWRMFMVFNGVFKKV